MYENDAAADLYDLIYQDRKDYRAEAARVAGLIRAHRPDAASLLDVACGTGAHLEAFAALFDRVAGLDRSDAMFRRAGQALREVPLHLGDMRSFRLQDSYDAVVCMFSSIGYLRTVEDLNDTLVSMAAHLTGNGVVVIEPWYFPDTFLDGYVSGHAVTRDGRTVARVSHSTRQGDRTRMEIHYLIGDADGIRARDEVDELTLFTRDQYETAFTEAGGKVEYVPASGSGPGYFVGVWP
jgi:SAM-dependent methyltransferase